MMVQRYKISLNDELFSLFRVANRTFAATKGQMSLVKVVRFTYIFYIYLGEKDYC